MELAPGKHLLAVQAESAVSTGTSPYVEVTNTGGGAAPNLYVLAVGIDAYPGNLALHYAAKDAAVFSRTLPEKGAKLFSKTEVKLIQDRAATREAIEQGLTWLRAKMTAQDVGVVFFSGHGAKDDRDNFYLVTVDVNPNDLAGSLFFGTAAQASPRRNPRPGDRRAGRLSFRGSRHGACAAVRRTT